MTTLDGIGFYTLSERRCSRASATTPIMRAEIVLGDACNFNCPYCRGQRRDIRKNLSYGEAVDYVHMLADQGVRNIRFSGGEPTLWGGLSQLVLFSEYSRIDRIAISTNGSANTALYDELIKCGANDFSVSLDSCCAKFGDKMAGKEGYWHKVVSNISYLAKRVYTTVGVVVTEETLPQLKETILFADSLGVSDIRIISAAQYNKILDTVTDLPQGLLNKYPILRYRVNNIKENVPIRGMCKTDSSRCWIGLDDVAIAGDYQFPCIIYLREQGDPIGKMRKSWRKDREEWVRSHDIKNDPICSANCLDCIVKYNNRYEEYRGLR